MKTKYLAMMGCLSILTLSACDNGSSVDSLSNVGDKEGVSSYKIIEMHLDRKTDFIIPNGSDIRDTLEVQFKVDSNSVYYIEFHHDYRRASIPELHQSDFYDFDTVLCEYGAELHRYFVPNSISGTKSIFIFGPPNTSISLYISKADISAWWRTRPKNINPSSFTKDSLQTSTPLPIKFGPNIPDFGWTTGNLLSTISGVRDGEDDIDRDWYSLKVDSGVDFRVELQSLRTGLIGADFFNDSGRQIYGNLSSNSRGDFNIYRRKYDLKFDTSKIIYMRVWSTFPAGYRISAYRI